MRVGDFSFEEPVANDTETIAKNTTPLKVALLCSSTPTFVAAWLGLMRLGLPVLLIGYVLYCLTFVSGTCIWHFKLLPKTWQRLLTDQRCALDLRISLRRLFDYVKTKITMMALPRYCILMTTTRPLLNVFLRCPADGYLAC